MYVCGPDNPDVQKPIKNCEVAYLQVNCEAYSRIWKWSLSIDSREWKKATGMGKKSAKKSSCGSLWDESEAPGAL